MRRRGFYGQISIRGQTNAEGVNLSKPCRKIIRIAPKGFRDRAATVLRLNNINEAVVVALLGHTPNSISMAYGATPWSEFKRAVKLL